jgi:hypothetical protein
MTFHPGKPPVVTINQPTQANLVSFVPDANVPENNVQDALTGLGDHKGHQQQHTFLTGQTQIPLDFVPIADTMEVYFSSIPQVGPGKWSVVGQNLLLLSPWRDNFINGDKIDLNYWHNPV